MEAICALSVLGSCFSSSIHDGAMEGSVCLSAPLDQELPEDVRRHVSHLATTPNINLTRSAASRKCVK